MEAADQQIADATTNQENTESLTEPTTEILSLLAKNTQLLAVGPNDPTIWEDRRSLVGKFNIDLEKELDLVGELAERHSKNYLIWDYRRWIVEKLGSEAASKELEFAKKILSKGTKNYQSWSHREWIIQKFDGSWWVDELQYCHEILEKDVFNTLAWDQICRAARSICDTDKELRDKEVSYAKEAIEAQPGNECPWTYLKCLYMKDKRALYTDPDLERIYVDVLVNEADRVVAAVELDPRYRMVDALADKRGCVHALNLILDLIVLGYKAKRNKRLVEAVNVLNDNCGQDDSRIYPHWVHVKSEIFRKVCALMLSLDARRIRYNNIYRGYFWFWNLHLGWEYEAQGWGQEDIADMDLSD